MASTARGVTRVLLLADAPVLRRGLVSMINETAGMQSVGTPGELRRALTLVESARPDAVVVELGSGRAATLNACRDLRRRFPRVAIVALATSEDPSVVNEALAAGVRGYLMINTSPTLLGWSILAARAGRTVVDPDPPGRALCRPGPQAVHARGAADPARVRRAGRAAAGPVQPADRAEPVHQRGHREVPCQGHPAQAGCPRPGPRGLPGAVQPPARLHLWRPRPGCGLDLRGRAVQLRHGARRDLIPATLSGRTGRPHPGRPVLRPAPCPPAAGGPRS